MPLRHSVPPSENVPNRQKRDADSETGKIQIVTRTAVDPPTHPRQDMKSFAEVGNAQHGESYSADQFEKGTGRSRP